MLFLQAKIQNVNDEDIIRFGPLNLDRTRKVMVRIQTHVADVVPVVVVDLIAGPVETFNAERLAGFNARGWRHVRMSSIDDRIRLFIGWRLRVHLEDSFWNDA